MQTTNDYLKTAEQYNNEVKSWGRKVRGISALILSTETHSTKTLRNSFKTNPRMDREKVYVNALGFTFNRYGAYRHYGAGRGYVVNNGVITRGYRLWDAKRKVWRNSDLRLQYHKRGYTDGQIRKMKSFGDSVSVPRTPLDWLDGPISKNINELADISGEYHGDQALRDVLKQLNKITIQKQYGKK